MRLDRGREHIADRQRLAAFALGFTREIIGHRQNRAEIVRWVSPLGRQPGVVEIQPAQLHADVVGGLHRIELEARARHARAAGQGRTRHQRAEVLHTLREVHRQHRAGQRIQQHVARGVVGLLRVDRVIDHVIGDIDHRLVGVRPLGRADVVMAHKSSMEIARERLARARIVKDQVFVFPGIFGTTTMTSGGRYRSGN